METRITDMAIESISERESEGEGGWLPVSIVMKLGGTNTGSADHHPEGEVSIQAIQIDSVAEHPLE